MTPGPTQVRENVRTARSRVCTNPDLDAEFVEFYKETCELISRLLHTKNETLILGGEGILGLEAACASLTEPGDRVLVIDNGIYGAGFADFVRLYGGEPTLYTVDDKHAVDPAALASYLREHHAFKYATVVHCDTPSGMCNPIGEICPLLKDYGILTVVDSVSAMLGERLEVDEWQLDVVCGGSQKCISAPPGLTLVTLSEAAKAAIRSRKKPIASFYANLSVFAHYYEEKWFPYTMPISDIYGLRAALDNIAADPDMQNRHERIARAARAAIAAAGLRNHLKSGFCNTVTVFDVPEGVTADQILETMKRDYGIMLSGSFDALSGKVIRIGHMGENCFEDKLIELFTALDGTFRTLGVPLECSMEAVFREELRSA